jgi:hypothetical protein
MTLRAFLVYTHLYNALGLLWVLHFGYLATKPPDVPLLCRNTLNTVTPVDFLVNHAFPCDSSRI